MKKSLSRAGIHEETQKNLWGQTVQVAKNIATFFYNEPKIDPERANPWGKSIVIPIQKAENYFFQNSKIIFLDGKKVEIFFGSLYRCKIF